MTAQTTPNASTRRRPNALAIVSVILLVFIAVGVALVAYQAAADDGRTRAADVKACVADNIASPTTRDCYR